MIEIISNDIAKHPICSPSYELTYNYMIGDAHGYTTFEVSCDVNNPYIERYVTLLNKLKPPKRYYGVVLESDKIQKMFDEGHFSEDDYEFLKRMLFCDNESKFVVEKENEEYSYDFGEGVRSETDYSWLTFTGIDLEYKDEYGVIFQTRIV